MIFAISILVAYGISPLNCHAADQVQNTLSSTEISASGFFDGIIWSVEDSKLTVTGTGAVLPGSSWFYPWESYRDQIESVAVGEGITALGDWAFAYMKCLEHIELPETLESIGEDCFSYDTALPELDLPCSVTSIGRNCAEGCTALQSASLPGVEDIPGRSFYKCSALEHITLSDRVSHVDANAFTGCERLLKDSPFVTVGSVLYTYTGNEHIVRIPEGITVIADGAFSAENRGVSQVQHNDRLVAVICPESLRHIGQKAFEKCDILMDVQLNEGCETIGTDAFTGCRSLKALTVPASVKRIGTQDKCSLTDLYGDAGSVAKTFAKRNQIAFHYRKPEHQGKDMTLDYQKDGWYFGNSKTVFGGDYFLTDADRQYLQQIGIDTANLDRPWSGSCVGLAITVILAKNGVFSPSELQSDAKTLSDIQPTDDVRSFINYYQCIQYDNAFSGSELNAQLFYRMLKNAASIPNGESPFLLTFTTKTGSHGVAGYGLESGDWEWDGKTYDGRVLIWDSNFPKALHDESCLYFDSATFDYCIPQYGIHVAEGAEDNTAGIITVCNDLNVLNQYPHPIADTAASTGTVSPDQAAATTYTTSDTDFLTSETTHTVYSDEDLCEWAEKDYFDKYQETVTAKIGRRDQDKLIITLSDDSGEIVDFYFVDAATGSGEDANGVKINLPQTGNNAVSDLLLVVAALMMIAAGAVTLSASGIIRRRKDQ